jgi:small-conductance mechanosensitive channel
MKRMRRLFSVLLVPVMLLAGVPVLAQTPAGFPGTGSSVSESGDTGAAEATAASPEQVRALLQLLADEKIVRWLQNELDTQTDIELSATTTDDDTVRAVAARRLDRVRVRAGELMNAMRELPQLPGKLHDRWLAGMTSDDTLRSVIYLLIFLFIGFGLEWLYWAYASLKLRQLELSNVAGLKASAKRAATVGLLRVGGATLFSLGCVGTFLFFDWPPLAGQVVLGVLMVAVILRVLLVVSRIIFAPASEHLRMVPMSTPLAKRCVQWIFIVVAVGLTSRVAADTFAQLGVDKSARISVYFLSAGAIACAFIVAIWVWFARAERVSSNPDHQSPSAGYALTSTATSPYVVPVALTVLTLVVLALDTLAMHKIKWLLLMFSLLVPAIMICKRLVDYYFDRAMTEDRLPVTSGMVSDDGATTESAMANMAQMPAGDSAEGTGAVGVEPVVQANIADSVTVDELSDDRLYHDEPPPFNVYRPVTQRLVRIAVIVCVVLAFFAIIDIPLWGVYQSDGLLSRIVAAIIDVAAVLLLADLLWVWTRTLIDRRLSEFEAPAHGQVPGPGARMATLLPLFRKGIFSVIAVMVVLVLLSSFGVNIAPLLAGAGVIGIAVGFGAQALVKDVVSGVFFLLEDAFRVGEYIEMGDLRGTVESISLRSLRVRHHLGAVHTIPYGELTSLTNHSRDWAIIKMEFRVPFDTDIKLVKKIVKKIGAELQQNEVYGHHIIEPLKSQGVRRMEEFNMVVGVKFMSTPGQQWTIRRDAYQAIRDAFDKNGLSFAERSVKVEVVGDGSASLDAIAGAAQEAIDEQIGQGPKPVDDTP